mmetsp:Transcript_29721/g.95850  ORF Transcript_29721/g.95850 Transcript_29721/m.95850 type:complete len:263 (-) Transcript_29721:650-1438(-)
MQAACRGSICLVVRLWRVVNDARALISDSLATSRPKTDATHTETWRPCKARDVGFGPTKRRSRAWEKADSAGPQATWNILGAAKAAALARSAADTAGSATEAFTGAKAGRCVPWAPPWPFGCCCPWAPPLSKDTEARTMSSRSRWKASAFRRLGFAPRPRELKTAVAPEVPDVLSARASRCFLSSSSVMGLDLMRSKMASKKSASKSLPSAMPRLFFRKPSLVMRFSSLMAGLWRSVWSMITEKASTKATSADGKMALFKTQ